MLYLLYFRNGFIKKFPLQKQTITIGRRQDNDLPLEELFVSKYHARITVLENEIEIEDLGSTNGIFVETERIHLVRIPLNECFRIGYLKFFLKKGNPDEFTISEKVLPLLNTITDAILEQSFETNQALNLLYSEPLLEILQSGFHLQDSLNLFQYADRMLSTSLKSGLLLLLEKQKNSTVILSEWCPDKSMTADLDMLLVRKDLFQEPISDETIPVGFHLCSFPVPFEKRHMALVYLSKDNFPPGKKTVEFLKILSMEISVIASLMKEDPGTENLFTLPPAIITEDENMLNLLSQCRKIAVSNLFILIEGETGTGKEMLARYIHAYSKRKKGNFVILNCGAFSENILETELFGHEKRSFSDTNEQAPGKLELASGGTIVLDEIGELPITIQAKLLQAIEEHGFIRTGGTQPVKVNLYMICLTKKNIRELIKAGRFREDLYYRIAHFTMRVPPLRERRDDIIPLINHYVKRFSDESKTYIKGFSTAAIKAMECYHWPGNIRELENEIKSLISLSESGDIIDIDRLKTEIRNFGSETTDLISDLKEMAATELLSVLNKHRWNKSLAARELGISRTTLYSKMKKVGLL